MASGPLGAGTVGVTDDVEDTNTEAENVIIQHQHTVEQTAKDQSSNPGAVIHTIVKLTVVGRLGVLTANVAALADQEASKQDDVHAHIQLLLIVADRAEDIPIRPEDAEAVFHVKKLVETSEVKATVNTS